jgi:hypothetical protein
VAGGAIGVSVFKTGHTVIAKPAASRRV